MNSYTPDDYYSNPALFHRLAQRERNRAISAGLAWLAARVKALAGSLRTEPLRWTERLG